MRMFKAKENKRFEILNCRNCKTTFVVALGTISIKCGSYIIFRNELNRIKCCCDKPNIHWYNSIDRIWLKK